ncbi:unnamed protein product [Discosporangium mesarthrocarpum]
MRVTDRGYLEGGVIIGPTPREGEAVSRSNDNDDTTTYRTQSNKRASEAQGTRETSSRHLNNQIAFPSNGGCGGDDHDVLSQVKEISERGDLRLLTRMLRTGAVMITRQVMVVAVRAGNPAVVELMTHLGKENDASFVPSFLGWCLGGEDSSDLPLHVACQLGHREVCVALLKFIVSCYGHSKCLTIVNAKDRFGRSPLHLASWTPHRHFRKKGHISVRDLLAHGADVKGRDKRGLTPLHWACRAADTVTTKVLLKEGADPLAEDEQCRTPLEACKRHQR